MNYLLVGKPNVGKSSIFNALTKSQLNIVHSSAGTTRDWHKENIKDSASYIFDTPGLILDQNDKNNLFQPSFQKLFINEVDIFLYVIEYSDKFNLNDNFRINQLRKFNKQIFLIINKFDNFKNNPIDDFNKYGLREKFFISCAHNFGLDDLRKVFSQSLIRNVLNANDYSIAIFGKPNVGKSTFLNTLLGYDRAETSPVAGTTSDHVIEFFKFKNKNIKIVDTAGIGKKSNIINKSVNDYSVKKTFENISIVDSSLIIIDALEGLDRQDKRIIKLVSEKSKSVIIIFNKLDLISDRVDYKSRTILDIENSLSQIKNIKFFFISALDNKNVYKIMDYLNNNIFIDNNKISTSNLNQWLKNVVKEKQHPLIEGKKVNFKYIVQIKTKPVTIKIFCNFASKLKDNYKRYLINQFNYKFKILNQRTKIIFTSSSNPYV